MKTTARVTARALRLLVATGALAAATAFPVGAQATTGGAMQHQAMHHHAMKHHKKHAMKHHAMKHHKKHAMRHHKHHAMKHHSKGAMQPASK